MRHGVTLPLKTICIRKSAYDFKNSPSHDIHVSKIAFGGTFSMMKMNLKMAMESPEWGAYGLSIESLSGVDWLGGCGAICGNDVPFKSALSHYCNR